MIEGFKDGLVGIGVVVSLNNSRVRPYYKKARAATASS
jgi:hypothetical protein